MKLSDALKELPNIKPRKARDLIVNDFRNELVNRLMDPSMSQEDEGKPFLFELSEGVSVRSDEFENNLLKEDEFDRKVITPKGARMLIDWYQRGVFELAKKSIGVSDPGAALLAFSKLRDDEAAERKPSHTDHVRAITEKPLAEIRESDFSFSVLNALFWREGRRGDSELVVGGFTVKKHVRTYTSNSGKSRDSTVEFRWMGSDGEERVVEKKSAFEGNRRSDPDRNWGLPE